MSTEAERIRAFVIDTFLFGEGGDALGDEDSLLAQGIIDSTGVLELAQYLEETFEVKVADEELVPENFDSIANLATFVRRRRGEQG